MAQQCKDVKLGSREGVVRPPEGVWLDHGATRLGILFFIGFIIYAHALSSPLIFDDTRHLVHNPRLQQIWPLSQLLGQTNRPVLDLTLAINYALGGQDPFGYRVLNVLIHILAAGVLMAVVRRAFECLPGIMRPHAVRLAFITALIWLVHPLQTQSVTYVIQRAECLMGFFYLMMIYGVMRYAESARWYWAATAVVCCWLGMGTKEVMVTAPLVTLMFDRIFLVSSWRELGQRRGWMYALMVAAWGWLALLMLTERPFAANIGTVPGLSPSMYAVQQLRVITHYLRLAFWPHPLILDYSWGIAAAPQMAWPAVVIPALLVVTLYGMVRFRRQAFWGAWFFVILAPTSSVIPIGDLIMEHRMYLPLAGVIALTVLLVDKLVGIRCAPEKAGRVGAIMAATAVLLLAGRTMWRNHTYRLPARIWAQAAAHNPQNDRAFLNWGNALMADEELEAAERVLRQGLDLLPDGAKLHYALGLALWRQNDLSGAEAELAQAVKYDPHLAAGYYLRGRIAEAREREDDAVAFWQRAVATDGNPESAAALGGWHFHNERYEEAVSLFGAAVAQQPGRLEWRYDLGTALAMDGRYQEAEAVFAEVVDRNPRFGDARQRLQKLHDILGKRGK